MKHIIKLGTIAIISGMLESKRVLPIALSTMLALGDMDVANAQQIATIVALQTKYSEPDMTILDNPNVMDSQKREIIRALYMYKASTYMMLTHSDSDIITDVITIMEARK